MRSLSSSMTRNFPISDWTAREHASRGFLQRRRPGDRGRELATVLWSGFDRIAGRKAVQHLAKAFLGQVLVGVASDQHHRSVHASAEALDLFPAEIAVLRHFKGIMMNATLADLDQVSCATEP